MKEKFLFVSWVANILAIFYILIPFVFINHYDEIIEVLYYTNLGTAFFYILSILTLVLCLYCIVDSKKKGKGALNVIILIFLNGLYTPFYYYSNYLKKEGK